MLIGSCCEAEKSAVALLALLSLLILLPLCCAKVCETPNCHRLAKILKNRIDPNVDPCHNFYNYACGKLVEYYKNPPEDILQEDAIEAVSRVREIGAKIIRNATDDGFESVDDSDPKTPNALKYAKRYYDSCKAWDPKSQLAQDQIVNYIRDFAIWPLFNEGDWLESDFNFIEVVGRLIGQHEIHSVVSLKIDIDMFEIPVRMALYLGPAKFSYENKYMNESLYPNFKNQYRKSIVRAFKTLILNAGITLKGGQVGLRKIAKDIVDFESDLFAQIIPEEQIKEGSIEELLKYYHPYTIKEMNKVYNDKKLWTRFFRAAVRNEPEGLAWFKNKTNNIIVVQEEYFKYLPQKYASTPKETIANYLLWKLVQEFGPLLGENYADVCGADQTNRRRKRDQPRETKLVHGDCFSSVDALFQDAVTRIYIDRRYQAAKETVADEITKGIVAAARQTFEGNTWLSAVAKERFIAKLDNVILNIGFPKYVRDNEKLDFAYDKWKVVPKNATYFENFVKFSTFIRDLFLIPATHNNNALYAPDVNSLTVPSGIMEFPMLDASFPRAFTFGSVGVIIGHEIFHGFDDRGVLYDAEGSIAASEDLGGPWLLESSNGTFLEKTQCIVDAYSKICYELQPLEPGSGNSFEDPSCIFNPARDKREVDEEEDKSLPGFPDEEPPPENYTLCVPGDYHLRENLADFNGMHASWKAFQAYQNKSGEDLRLPGLEQYDANQLYFLGFSTWPCAPFNQRILEILLRRGDPHSPNDARVNGAVTQLPAFGEAFKCKKGDPMYPETVCSVY